jgi:hypothetical protein
LCSTLINALVSAAFNNTVRNSYDLRSRADHHLDTAKAKFVLCPSGTRLHRSKLLISNYLSSILAVWLVLSLILNVFTG